MEPARDQLHVSFQINPISTKFSDYHSQQLSWIHNFTCRTQNLITCNVFSFQRYGTFKRVKECYSKKQVNIPNQTPAEIILNGTKTPILNFSLRLTHLWICLSRVTQGETKIKELKSFKIMKSKNQKFGISPAFGRFVMISLCKNSSCQSRQLVDSKTLVNTLGRYYN